MTITTKKYVLLSTCVQSRIHCTFMTLLLDNVGEGITFLGRPVVPFYSFIRSFIRSSGQVFLPGYLMNGLNKFDKTDMEYSTAPIDDLIRFWRSKVKTTAGRQSHVL